ncbi:alpha/beta hydrolase [Streptomyces sp. MP131-18]|uniref:alpha/beta hydrolase n=1 Tax=Streptomyces sp. MP131-18 TaxID=1857892 RepID=UPI00097C2CA8|nr:alpha/beta hydrolase [Streptomyces sp. MP131-18]ONK14167.1 Carboxylesterase NlhH [Streptomyces sp. MP131-18]
MPGTLPRARTALRWASLLSAAATATTALLAAGLVLLPAPSWTAWQFGLLALEFSLFLAVLCGVGCASAAFARGLPGPRLRRAATALLAVNALAATAALLPPAAAWRTAQAHGIGLSLRDYVTGGLAVTADREPETIAYASPGGEDLLLDVWEPSDRPADGDPLPVVINVHGGAEDEPQSMLPRWDAWLADQGYLVIDVDYRFFPPGDWQAPVADVMCAIGWAAANSARYGGDPERIAVMGQSAGGLIGLLAAYTPPGDIEPSCPAAGPGTGQDVGAVLAWYAVTDLTPQAPALPWRQRHSPIGDELARSNEEMMGGTAEEKPREYRAASPVTHVRPGLPPTLLLQGGWDLLNTADDNRRFAGRLADAGVPHRLVELPFTEHMFDINWGGFGSQIARAELTRFLDRHL